MSDNMYYVPISCLDDPLYLDLCLQSLRKLCNFSLNISIVIANDNEAICPSLAESLQIATLR
jgi:hypothetical protein